MKNNKVKKPKNFACNAPESFLPCNVNDNGKCTLPTHCDYQIKVRKTNLSRLI